jgi:hypothetical protein
MCKDHYKQRIMLLHELVTKNLANKIFEASQHSVCALFLLFPQDLELTVSNKGKKTYIDCIMH